MPNERRQYGELTLEKSEDGLWAWIEDKAGDIVCEISYGLDLSEVPACLHAQVKSAYEWAIIQNKHLLEESG